MSRTRYQSIGEDAIAGLSLEVEVQKSFPGFYLSFNLPRRSLLGLVAFVEHGDCDFCIHWNGEGLANGLHLLCMCRMPSALGVLPTYIILT